MNLNNQKIIKQIISIYLENKTHSYFPEKDRLNFSLCLNELEKREHTLKEIEYCNKIIKELDFGELSSAFIRSKPGVSKVNSFENLESHAQFWLERFALEVIENTETLFPITLLAEEFFNTNLLDDACFEREDFFWDSCHKYIIPKNKNLELVIKGEKELFNYLEYEFLQYKVNGYWEIEIDEIIAFQEFNTSIDYLLKASDLLTYLHRREMFLSFIEIENDKKEVEEPELLDTVLFACTRLQGDKKYWGKKIHENDRNRYVANMLEIAGLKKHTVKDQTQWSRSSSGKNSGELDIFIFKKNGLPLSIIEAFNLDSLKSNIIEEHLDRLFNYDTSGHKVNFILIYSTANQFDRLWMKYMDFNKSYKHKYKLSDFQEISKYEYSDIRIGLSNHFRNGLNVQCIHIMINMVF